MKEVTKNSGGILPRPGLRSDANVDPTRSTPSMASSLQKMYASLHCPICHQLMKDPATLSCTHSFCLECISNSKEWNCVVPGCHVPVAVRGKKSYRINPQLSTVISSLEIIHETINRAQPQWWKSASLSQSQSQSQVSMDEPVDLAMGMDDQEDTDSEHSEGKVDLGALKSDEDIKKNNEEVKDGIADNGSCADDSDATTLDLNVEDDESISAPILKRQKRESTKIFFQGSDASSPKTKNSGKLTIRSKSPMPSDDESIATERRNINIRSIGVNIKTVKKRNSKRSPNGRMNDSDDGNDGNYSESIDSEENHELFSDNQTPQDINKSCVIPDVSFRLSPIEMGNSQSQNNYISSFKDADGVTSNEIAEEMSGMDNSTVTAEAVSAKKKIVGGKDSDAVTLNDITEEMSEIDNSTATTEAISTKKHIVGCSTKGGSEEVTVPMDCEKDMQLFHIEKETDMKTSESDTIASERIISDKGVKASSSILKKLQENVPLEDQKTPELNPKTKRKTKCSTLEKVRASTDEVHDERNTIIQHRKVIASPGQSRGQFAEMKNINSTRPPIPQVFLLSPSQSLSSADQRSIRKFAKNERLQILQDTRKENCENNIEFNLNFDSDEDMKLFMHSLYTRDVNSRFPVEYSYAICSNAEYQTFEGYIMPRSFRFVLAVASGLSIINISFLRDTKSASFGANDPRKYVYAPGTVKPDDDAVQNGNRRKRSRGRDDAQKEEHYQIAGDVESIDLMGPQRSRETLMNRLGESSEHFLEYNNGLLKGYQVLLFGNFDHLPTSQTNKQPIRKGRKKVDKANKPSNESSDNAYTKGRVSLLLRLCGAHVEDLEAISSNRLSTFERIGKKLIVLTRDEADTKVKKRIYSTIKGIGISDVRVEDVPVVCCKWLEDSIATFKLKCFT